MRYWELGAGEVLLLVHGLFGDADVWKEIAPLARLGREGRVVALDLRGHGQSDKPTGSDAYGATMVDDVVALLDHLGVERAHVLGASYGGLVAGAVLERHPDRLRSLVLGGCSRVRPGTRADVRWATALAEELEDENGADWLAAALATGDADRDASQRELIDRRMAHADLAAAAAMLRSTSELAVSDETLAASRVPILGLVGELDPSAGEVQAMASTTAGMTCEVIPDADHAGAPRTTRFWDSVVEWWRSLRGDAMEAR